jgi:hypothetical protein
MRSGLVSVFGIGAILGGCTEVPNLKTSDRYGPIQRAAWLDLNAPRPGPVMAFHASCRNVGDLSACQHERYERFLVALGQTPLPQTGTSRSYRYIAIPACSHVLAIRLDVEADGSGVLNFNTATGETNNNLSGRLLISTSLVRQFEFDVKQSGIWRIMPDPRALLGRHGCYDGWTDVFESTQAGRYRLVYRHNCEPNHAVIERIGARMRSMMPVAPPPMTGC